MACITIKEEQASEDLPEEADSIYFESTDVCPKVEASVSYSQDGDWSWEEEEKVEKDKTHPVKLNFIGNINCGNDKIELYPAVLSAAINDENWAERVVDTERNELAELTESDESCGSPSVSTAAPLWDKYPSHRVYPPPPPLTPRPNSSHSSDELTEGKASSIVGKMFTKVATGSNRFKIVGNKVFECKEVITKNIAKKDANSQIRFLKKDWIEYQGVDACGKKPQFITLQNTHNGASKIVLGLKTPRKSAEEENKRSRSLGTAVAPDDTRSFGRLRGSNILPVQRPVLRPRVAASAQPKSTHTQESVINLTQLATSLSREGRPTPSRVRMIIQGRSSACSPPPPAVAAVKTTPTVATAATTHPVPIPSTHSTNLTQFAKMLKEAMADPWCVQINDKNCLKIVRLNERSFDPIVEMAIVIPQSGKIFVTVMGKRLENDHFLWRFFTQKLTDSCGYLKITAILQIVGWLHNYRACLGENVNCKRLAKYPGSKCPTCLMSSRSHQTTSATTSQTNGENTKREISCVKKPEKPGHSAKSNKLSADTGQPIPRITTRCVSQKMVDRENESGKKGGSVRSGGGDPCRTSTDVAVCQESNKRKRMGPQAALNASEKNHLNNSEASQPKKKMSLLAGLPNKISNTSRLGLLRESIAQAKGSLKSSRESSPLLDDADKWAKRTHEIENLFSMLRTNINSELSLLTIKTESGEKSLVTQEEVLGAIGLTRRNSATEPTLRKSKRERKQDGKCVERLKSLNELRFLESNWEHVKSLFCSNLHFGQYSQLSDAKLHKGLEITESLLTEWYRLVDDNPGFLLDIVIEPIDHGDTQSLSTEGLRHALSLNVKQIIRLRTSLKSICPVFKKMLTEIRGKFTDIALLLDDSVLNCRL